jgi:hypothetical protein
MALVGGSTKEKQANGNTQETAETLILLDGGKAGGGRGGGEEGGQRTDSATALNEIDSRRV